MPSNRHAIQMARDYLARSLVILESDRVPGDIQISLKIIRSGDKQLEMALDQPVIEKRSSSPWTALGIGIGLGLGFLFQRFAH
jgi:hypothetical protein